MAQFDDQGGDQAWRFVARCATGAEFMTNREGEGLFKRLARTGDIRQVAGTSQFRARSLADFRVSVATAVASEEGATVVTVSEAAARLGLTPRRVQQLIERGILPAEQHGTILLIDVSDLSRAAGRRRPGWPKGKPRT